MREISFHHSNQMEECRWRWPLWREAAPPAVNPKRWLPAACWLWMQQICFKKLIVCVNTMCNTYLHIVCVNTINNDCVKWKWFPSCIRICQLVTTWHSSPWHHPQTQGTAEEVRGCFFLEVILSYSLFKFKNSECVLFPWLYLLSWVSDFIGYI